MILQNRPKIMKFFIDNGYSPEQSAGIAGNLAQESGFDPTISQIGGGGGFGLSQWTHPSRKMALAAFAIDKGVDVTDFQTQLEFIAHELALPGFRRAEVLLRDAKTVEQATRAICVFYEMPGKPMMDRRIKYAMEAYDEYVALEKDT